MKKKYVCLTAVAAALVSGCANPAAERFYADSERTSVSEKAYTSPASRAEGPVQGEGGVVFNYYGSGSRVFVAGEFNNWSGNSVPMVRTGNGFSASLDITPGIYRYMFIVDGNWITDPGNPETVSDGRGGINSMLRVR